MREGFELKRVVTIRDVMALTVHASDDIEQQITHPVENEQHLNLLPEMDLFVPNQLGLIVSLAGYPDEDEKRESRVIIEYLFPGIDLIR